MELLVKNANEALVVLPSVVRRFGVPEHTRNGPVITMTQPFMLRTERPMERVLLCPNRRANPFLFLIDGLSVLSSVNLVRPFSRIVPRFTQYSDDGVRLRGHYGHRLYHQIPKAIRMLRESPASRQVTLQIWNAVEDLWVQSVDVPCNLHINLRVVSERLNLTVFNRSNDLFWGMLGANIVQFSFLQEYIARSIDVEVGELTQVSTNLHLYTGFGPGKDVHKTFTVFNRYPPVVPLETGGLVSELNRLFLSLGDDQVPLHSSNSFVDQVVLPMMHAHRTGSADILNDYPNCDWFVAARMFLKGENS